MVALEGFRGLWYIYVMRFLILFSSIIPISLRVNLDMGKTVYSMQIMRDQRIPSTIVRSSTIPEELGRIEYLLSDKTGTLTKNDMELKRLHLGTMAYGVESMDEISSQLLAAYSNDQNYRGKRTRDISYRIREIVLALGICHNVTPVYEDGILEFQASSPDEMVRFILMQAIVKWTKSVGLTLTGRTLTTLQLTTPTGATMKFEILYIFPFTSESKRMGIIVRDAEGEVVFYQKGADTVMSSIVAYNDWLDEECGNMAREGLRTLVVAKKRLTADMFAEFSRKFESARVAMGDRAAAMTETLAMLEKDLELLGVTGVEDKLQDEVKPTLELLRNAGLKIWMLTGDKIETACCIAISSKLVGRNQNIHEIAKSNICLISVTDPMDVLEQLEAVRAKNDCCMVIDGQSLETCLRHNQQVFMDVAVRLPAVVCCRCSPTQKSEITKLIASYTGKRTCAIGDGGNDVSMIQSAHVGVGIVGKEGKQASLAADFSITQFSHLARLLLWHGRNSYRRSAKLSQFIIHRGLEYF